MPQRTVLYRPHLIRWGSINSTDLFIVTLREKKKKKRKSNDVGAVPVVPYVAAILSTLAPVELEVLTLVDTEWASI